jgi:hypothetical protein
MAPHRTLLKPLLRHDPDRIGSYVLLGRLGAGAMGQVYLGRSAAGRLVAVKTIKLEYAEEPDFRARFAREVTAAGRVSGVFTAAVVEADPDAAVPWLATAYVPAPSLDQLVQVTGPLPVPAIWWLAAGCAEALASIHNAGLVHRDLKPSNVLVAADGPRVIDFGVARAVEQLHGSTAHGSVGTPAYMAPEQARDTRQATVASDVFSLGSTLLYAVTGHPPYRGDTVVDILVQLMNEPPDVSGLPIDVSDIVLGCLDRDPAQRPTPAELLAELEPYVESAGGHDLGPSALPLRALELIEEYRARPEAAGRADEPAVMEATVGSEPGLSAPRRRPVPAPASRRPVLLGGGARRPGTGPGAWARPRPPVAGRILTIVASIGAVVGLIIFGAVLNSWIDGGKPASQGAQQPNGQQPGGQQPDGGPDGHGGPPPIPPPDGDQGRGGPPVFKVNQPSGDQETMFVVYGRGWPPGTVVTISLGRRPSKFTVTADRAGAFNYTINQSHEFYPAALPPGELAATAQGAGITQHVSFTVHG